MHAEAVRIEANAENFDDEMDAEDMRGDDCGVRYRVEGNIT